MWNEAEFLFIDWQIFSNRLIKKTSVFFLCGFFSFSFLFDLSVSFSLTPRSYQLFWQQMCGNFPPSVVFCEDSWLSISILILKWDIRIGYWNEYQLHTHPDMSVCGYVRFRSWGLSPTRRPPPHFRHWSQGPAVSVWVPGGRGRGSQTSASNM